MAGKDASRGTDGTTAAAASVPPVIAPPAEAPPAEAPPAEAPPAEAAPAPEETTVGQAERASQQATAAATRAEAAADRLEQAATRTESAAAGLEAATTEAKKAADQAKVTAAQAVAPAAPPRGHLWRWVILAAVLALLAQLTLTIPMLGLASRLLVFSRVGDTKQLMDEWTPPPRATAKALIDHASNDLGAAPAGSGIPTPATTPADRLALAQAILAQEGNDYARHSTDYAYTGLLYTVWLAMVAVLLAALGAAVAVGTAVWEARRSRS